MDHDYSVRLVDAIEQNLNRYVVDRPRLIQSLDEVITPLPPYFVTDIKSHPVALGSDGQQHHDYLTLIKLVNKAEPKAAQPSIVHVIDPLLYWTGLLDPESAIEHIRLSREIMEAMRQSPVPYSLLGEMESFESCEPSVAGFMTFTPVLGIVGADTEMLRKWQDGQRRFRKLFLDSSERPVREFSHS